MTHPRVIISASVGRDGKNRFVDVRAIQNLINHHLPPALNPLKEDGVCGPRTVKAIEEVERLYIRQSPPDGRLDPHGPTLRALNTAAPARRRNTAAVTPTAPPRPERIARVTPSSAGARGTIPAERRPNPSATVAVAPAGSQITAPGITPAAIAAAQATQRRWNVPASITLAQYVQESSAGRHMPPGSNNPFGMKARRGQASVTARTREETRNGGSVYIKAPFRKFESINQAFDAHAELLATGRAYALARQHVNDPDAYADALTHHYATDSHYGRELKKVMRRHNLYQYDVQ